MKIEFPGRRVIVAGAAQGLGRAIVEAFAAGGAEVFACDILDEQIRRYVAEMPSHGAQVHVARADVTNPASIAKLVADATADGAAIDVLVYVAGGVRGQVQQPVEEVSLEDWRAIVDVNLTGAFLFAKAVAPGMKKAGHGRIVTISSRAGLATSLTGIQSYASAKHGQLGLVKQLAQELGPFGITVNSVAPGFFATNPASDKQWESYGPEGQKAFLERIAMRRMGRPEDIAHAVLFLSSDYASWITGQVLPVTGGPVA